MDCSPNRSSRRRGARRRGTDRPGIECLDTGELLLLGLATLPPDFDADDGTPVAGVRDLPAVADIAAKGEKHVEANPATTVPALCGLYVYELTTRRPFEAGRNYPAALRVVRYVARLNRWRFDLTDAEWSAFLGDVARGDLTEEQFANVVAAFLQPRALRAM